MKRVKRSKAAKLLKAQILLLKTIVPTMHSFFFFSLNSKFNKFLETSIMMIEEENMPLNGPIWLALPVPYQVSFLFFS